MLSVVAILLAFSLLFVCCAIFVLVVRDSPEFTDAIKDILK